MTFEYTAEQMKEFTRIRDETLARAESLSERLRSPTYANPVLRKRDLMIFYANDLGKYIDSVPEDVRKEFDLGSKIKDLFNNR